MDVAFDHIKDLDIPAVESALAMLADDYDQRRTADGPACSINVFYSADAPTSARLTHIAGQVGFRFGYAYHCNTENGEALISTCVFLGELS